MHCNHTCSRTATKDESLSLLTLSNELSSVSGWYMLGLNLGVAPDQLDAIKTSPVMLSGDEKRTEMLNIWLKNSQGASWQEVVTALRNIREVRLAEAIEKKHPASPGESHARIHPGQLILCSGIHQGYIRPGYMGNKVHHSLLLKLEAICWFLVIRLNWL